MQKYSATSFFARVKYAVTGEMRRNSKLYSIYFVFLVLGVALGIVWGIMLVDGVAECVVRNYVAEFTCGDSGLFTVFFSRLFTYVFVFVILILAFKFTAISYSLYFVVSFVLAKFVRDGMWLALSGGVSAILSGLLFYIIFGIIYCSLLSFLVIYIILGRKSVPCFPQKKDFTKFVIFYSVLLVICVLYTIVLSLLFIILT